MLKKKKYYNPTDLGYELKIKKHLESLNKQREKKLQGKTHIEPARKKYFTKTRKCVKINLVKMDKSSIRKALLEKLTFAEFKFPELSLINA